MSETTPDTPQTLYKHVGTDPVDPTFWPDSGQKDADGAELYTFSGDTEPGQANGISDQWEVTTAAPAASASTTTDPTAPEAETEQTTTDADSNPEDAVFMINDDGLPYKVDPNTPAS